jgi:hypothetical protein
MSVKDVVERIYSLAAGCVELEKKTRRCWYVNKIDAAEINCDDEMCSVAIYSNSVKVSILTDAKMERIYEATVVEL